jgi:hypothetical protein
VAKASFGYIGDNGTTYQLAWEAANEALLAGNLPAAVALSPLFPALWTPRYFLARLGVAPFTELKCICQATNASFIAGPGTAVTIVLTVYTIMACIGEERSG